MPPRKVKISSRKETQRDIAVRRAEHFAVTNSTPSGVIAGDTVPNYEGRVSGPFTIANEILSQAAANRRLREDAYELENQDELDAITGKDIYEEKLKEIIKESRTEAGNNGNSSGLNGVQGERNCRHERQMTGPIDSLQDLCIKKLVSVFDLVDDLDGLHPETLARLATALGKARKFDTRAALLVANPDTDSVYLPECSTLEEETLLKALGQVTMPLRSLQLRNCGHCLNDKTALVISERVFTLEVLELGGCYKLGDVALETLLSKCASLQELLLPCNSRLGNQGLGAIRNVCTLRCLSLQDCTHLTDEQLLVLLGDDSTVNNSSSSRSGGGSSSSSSSSSSVSSPLHLLEDISLCGALWNHREECRATAKGIWVQS